MFNWFKSRKKSLLTTVWNIDHIPGFEKIQNDDSVQYVNEDSSRVIYFSVLTVSGNGDLLPSAFDGDPTVTESGDVWHVKGKKKSNSRILIYLITVQKKEDIEWAKTFLSSIRSEEE